MNHMWNEIMEQPAVLERCMESNKETAKCLVEHLKNQNIGSVVIAARGTSDHAAVYGKYVIELLTGIPVGLAAPSIFTMYNKSVNLKNSLVIGISQSGKAQDVLEVVKAANSQGAVTVSITNFTGSPLAMESKYHLHCNAGIEKSVAATKTFTSQMILMAQLATKWADDQDTRNCLSLVPGKVFDTLKNAETIKDTVKRYRFIDECFVLARGINYSIALECALKIQETTYVRAKAFATSDFYHGPFALIDKDIPIIIFAPDGPSRTDVSVMINKLKEKGIEMIIISNNQQLLKLGTCSLPIPETNNDIISPFFNVVTAQMFACCLSLTKGLNPDSPRELNKVTITR